MQTLICLNNYDQKSAEIELSATIDLAHSRFILGNYINIESQVVMHHQVLRPYETRVILISADSEDYLGS
ncbi:hypothetical protein P4S72_09570 [Vibrio sp. PP-XX7]